MRITTLFARQLTQKFAMMALILGMLGAVTTPAIIHAKTESKENTKSDESSDEKKSDSEEKSGSSNFDSDSSDEKDTDKNADEEASDDESKSDLLTVENLPKKLDDILQSASRSSEWGVKVVVAETGQTLFESNANEGFIPASNRKLFTGALALDQLGPDYKFRTYLYKTGNVDSNGKLNGNLVIVPSGDPTFNNKTLYRSSKPPTDWVFRDWAKKVKEAGIKSIKGDLLIDCSGWDMNDLTPYGWAKRVLNDSYAPQTSPLTINENLAAIILRPGKSGKPASVSFAPSATGYPVLNKTESGESGNLVANRVVNKHIEISGGVSSKKTIWSFPIDRPTLFAAANFRHHLKEAEIPIEGSIRIITTNGALPGPNARNTIALVESPRLIEIIDYMMKRSDNHIAEQVYVSISAAKLGKGSYSNSRRLEAGLLTRAGIDPREVECYDGCGLSEANSVTPRDICKLLTFMRGHRYAQEYYDCMAVSGREGTLRNRMGRIAGRVHAKTGTINGVKTLSGYLKLAADKTISFSFLVNHIKGGSAASAQDRLCNTIAALVL